MNNIQELKIQAIIGNAKIGSEKIDLDVADLGSGYCKHQDSKRLLEVS